MIFGLRGEFPVTNILLQVEYIRNRRLVDQNFFREHAAFKVSAVLTIIDEVLINTTLELNLL